MTAAAPHSALPAPISMEVCRSSPNSRVPSCTAMTKVSTTISASIRIPAHPTAAICWNVIRRPNKTMPARSSVLFEKSTPVAVRVAIAGKNVLPATMPKTMASVSALRPRCRAHGVPEARMPAAATRPARASPSQPDGVRNGWTEGCVSCVMGREVTSKC